MNTVTMDMSGYEIERDTADTDEDSCADWRPDTTIQQYSDTKKRMPVDLISVDVDAFMSRMYAHQR